LVLPRTCCVSVKRNQDQKCTSARPSALTAVTLKALSSGLRSRAVQRAWTLQRNITLLSSGSKSMPIRDRRIILTDHTSSFYTREGTERVTPLWPLRALGPGDLHVLLGPISRACPSRVWRLLTYFPHNRFTQGGDVISFTSRPRFNSPHKKDSCYVLQ
jgi:hypothetical protein